MRLVVVVVVAVVEGHDGNKLAFPRKRTLLDVMIVLLLILLECLSHGVHKLDCCSKTLLQVEMCTSVKHE